MSDACPTCGSERSLSRCWKLCCPTNGGSYELLAIVGQPIPVKIREVRPTQLRYTRIDEQTDLFLEGESDEAIHDD